MWVLDTNVVLDWLIFADPASLPLAARITAGAARLVTRADCRAELARVLDYPRVPASPEQRREALLTYDRMAMLWPERAAGAPLAAGSNEPSAPRAEAHTLRPALWGDALGAAPPLPLCRDPDDQKFLELARDARADWLITKDRMLLKLARQTRALGLFQVLDPRQATLVLRAEPEHALSSSPAVPGARTAP